MVLFFKHIGHRFTDLFNYSLPGFSVLANIPKRFNFDFIPAQTDFDRKTINTLQILFLPLETDIAGF